MLVTAIARAKTSTKAARSAAGPMCAPSGSSATNPRPTKNGNTMPVIVTAATVLRSSALNEERTSSPR